MLGRPLRVSKENVKIVTGYVKKGLIKLMFTSYSTCVEDDRTFTER